ncbi:MAG TPA: TIGR01777 family oxidoreductase [Cyclobacteriaceae bacterium]|nr:TIGR01777 family oxidoreductase [Cyclobacteriaceae bacterium]
MDRIGLKKIVIAGGSGFVGRALTKHFSAFYHVIVLSRATNWDGRTLGAWVNELDGAYALINLTGKNVNCRYTGKNRKEILDSRVLSTKILGEAIRKVSDPPKVWIQMSSATIYRHSEDKPNDETFGEIGADFSMNVCKAWEKAFNEIQMSDIRRVIMRTSIVMGNDGGAFPPLKKLVKSGLGGKQGKGTQMVSWIHVEDIVGVVEWMLQGSASGVYNVTAPQPVSNRIFMKQLRAAYKAWIAFPATEWMLKIGARLIGTETELVLKSRWVIPKRLIQDGYRFKFPTLESALKELVGK